MNGIILNLTNDLGISVKQANNLLFVMLMIAIFFLSYLNKRRRMLEAKDAKNYNIHYKVIEYALGFAVALGAVAALISITT